MITMLSMDDEVRAVWKRIARNYAHGMGVRLSFDDVRAMYLGDQAWETTLGSILFPEDDEEEAIDEK